MRFVCCSVLWCLLALGASKPNFSAEWRLNPGRSEFGGLPAPKKLTHKVTHKDPDFAITTIEISQLDQELKQALKYTTDGKEQSNKISGILIKNTAEWADNELALHLWYEFGGRSVDIKEQWKIVEEGTTLYISRHVEGVGGKTDQVLVFDKAWEK